MQALKLRTFDRTTDQDEPFPFPRSGAGRWQPKIHEERTDAGHRFMHPAERALEEAQRRLDALRTMMNNEFDDDGPRAA
ncbi:MAG: hypothetical protein JNL50_03775 [Phycisphaerae bacterium]|nr:hypothetical protein [Phycisphaerae bacterium]